MSPADGERARLRLLAAERDEIARRWVVRAVQDAGLEEIARLRTDRVAERLPELIADLLRAAEGDGAIGESGALRRRTVDRLASLRSAESEDQSGPARDLVELGSAIVDVLAAGLDDPAARASLAAADRVGRVVAGMLADALAELVAVRTVELETLAHTDPLTGLRNITYLRDQLDHLIGVQRRYGHPFALLVIDVDGMRRINDAYGDAAGDRALVALAWVLSDNVRAVDAAVRLGGDDFCVLVPHQTTARARTLGERIARAVAALREPEVGLSISVGVAGCPQHGDDPERLLDVADEAMYRSKAAGEPITVAAAAGAEQPDGPSDS